MVRLISYSVYLLSNQHKTVFYTGVTSDLERRVFEHKQGEGGAFTAKYNCHWLMYYEDYADIRHAIAREKQLKKWLRQWKVELIKKENPEMKDLAARWY
jgi:putative endonuclease